MREAGTHDQHIDEEADQPLNLRPGAVSQCGSNGDVCLTRITEEQYQEDCQYGHKERCLFLSAEVL